MCSGLETLLDNAAETEDNLFVRVGGQLVACQKLWQPVGAKNVSNNNKLFPNVLSLLSTCYKEMLKVSGEGINTERAIVVSSNQVELFTQKHPFRRNRIRLLSN